MIFELLVGLVVVVLLVLLIGFAVDKLTDGGDGIWYGPGEPPEGFIGFWDRGQTVVQWPSPVADDKTIEELIEDSLKENADGTV